MPRFSRSLTEVLENPGLMHSSHPPSFFCSFFLFHAAILLTSGKTGRQMETFCDNTVNPQQRSCPELLIMRRTLRGWEDVPLKAAVFKDIFASEPPQHFPAYFLSGLVALQLSCPDRLLNSDHTPYLISLSFHSSSVQWIL